MLLVSDGPGRYCTNRLFEWFAVVYMSSLGFLTLVNNPVDSRVMQIIVERFHDQRYVGIFLLFLGAFRATILVINGRAPTWGPRLRGATSMIGSMVWSYFTISVIIFSLQTHVYYASLATYASLMVFELIAAFRAAFDSGRRVVGQMSPPHDD